MSKPNQTKPKQTHTYREQITGYQRGRVVGEGEMAKGGQLYGERWKLNFW